MSVTIDLSVPLERRFDLLRALAIEGAHNPVVRDLAEDLVRGLSPELWLERLTVAVQSLPLVLDPPGVDVYQNALETLAYGGDCASKCVLLAALIAGLYSRAGASVRVALCWEHNAIQGAQDHVVLSVLPAGSSEWVLADSLAVGLNVRAVSWAPEWVRCVAVL